MQLNSKEIFERLLKLYKTKKIKELSIKLGFKENWGSSARNRDSIPFEACVKASIDHNVSMDYLLFGKKTNNNLDINELKIAITEGVFAAVQTDMIALNKGVKISNITNAITEEIIENCNIEISENIKKAI